MSGNIGNKIRADADKYPRTHIILITLFAVGLVSLPVDRLFTALFGEGKAVLLGADIFIRVVLSAAAIYFLFVYGYGKIIFSRVNFKGMLAVLPAFIVALNNFPFVAFISGNATITADTGEIILYAIYCISVGVYEETVFRGLIFPLCLKISGGRKHGVFYAVLISSAIFGAVHLVNLFSGGGIGAVLLQTGYSFLIGGMCAVSVCLSENLFTAVAVHALFDVGGLIFGSRIGIAEGFQWDAVTVVITAVIGVIVAAYMLYRLFNLKYDEVKSLYKPNEN